MKNAILILWLLFLMPGGIHRSQAQILTIPVPTEEVNNHDGIPTSAHDGDGILIESTAKSTSSVEENINPPSDSLFIGKPYGGGKIYWLDATGKHGLIAAEKDQSAKGIEWKPGKPVLTGSKGDGCYAGLANTERIISVQGKNEQYAAKLCSEYSITVNRYVYDDWYLPARYELGLLFKQRKIIGGFNTENGIYWSSTEAKTDPETLAWEQEFKLGGLFEDDKDNPDQVRCIRKF